MTGIEYFVCVLSANGAAALIARRGKGPASAARERLLRRMRKNKAAKFLRDLLTCEVCVSFWTGVVCGTIAWAATGSPMGLTACVVSPLLADRLSRLGTARHSGGCGCGKATDRPAATRPAPTRPSSAKACPTPPMTPDSGD